MAWSFYGNWGGPGWSNGRFTAPGEVINWNGPGLCCTKLIQPEIPPTPDAATPQHAPPRLPVVRAA